MRLKTKELKNEFSWSKSRHELFRECKRKYYYNKYASWGGWKATADPARREVYILKNLKTRQMWMGERVHRSIEDVLTRLRDAREVSREQVIALLTDRMRQDYLDSHRARYREDPRRFCGLIEHEYEMDVPRTEWQVLHEKAIHCIETFFHSDIYHTVHSLPSQNWLSIEEISSFELYQTRIYIKLDLAMREGSRIFIYDWKTGETDGDIELQMGCYALYAMAAWQSTPEHLVLIEFNLSKNSVVEHAFSDTVTQKITTDIIDSVEQMKRLLRDRNANSAREEDFPFTEQEWICSRCQFRSICQKFSPAKA